MSIVVKLGTDGHPRTLCLSGSEGFWVSMLRLVEPLFEWAPETQESCSTFSNKTLETWLRKPWPSSKIDRAGPILVFLALMAAGMPGRHGRHHAIIERKARTQAMLRSKLGTLLLVSAALSCAAGFALDARGSIAYLELWLALAVLLLLGGAVLIVLGQND
ncbi:MAG: hypothetical protein E2585_09340 [Comamonas sp.]|uniref:hypothetical protein n=1 Tax=Comamonas TaxID=283 RepID=UPI001186E4ED|nr:MULTISPECIES: hypothetical protein [Comamonas]MPS88871.1 hypothetical protein [Comamonas sp.]